MPRPRAYCIYFLDHHLSPFRVNRGILMRSLAPSYTVVRSLSIVSRPVGPSARSCETHVRMYVCLMVIPAFFRAQFSHR
jgi:hypothetical protein